MYLEHFGLREPPFSITPHTEFFFAGANRGATLEALIYAITHDEGIVKVSGEVGSGKTMLCRMLLAKLPEHVETAYLATPSLSREDVLQAIADELKIEIAGSRPHQMMRALQEHLLDIHASGRQIVVLIDEAHAMPSETLEEIRLLSNLETDRHKLLHIVLFGQPELDERLAGKDMRQLKDRITHNFALEPLHRNDVGDYLMFRLRAAGYHGPDLIAPGAVRLLSRASQGLTRRVNILADKALLAAFADGKHAVGRRQVRTAIRDAQFTSMSGRRPPLSTMIAAGIALATITALLLWLQKGPTPAITPNAAPPSLEHPASTVSPAMVREPTTTTVGARALPEEFSQSAPPQPQTLDERIASTDAWLKNTPENRYFIQLLSTDASNPDVVQAFIDRLAGKVDAQKIRVYRSRLSGRERLGVIYGDYVTRDAANAELAQLSRISPAGNPYIRTVGKLK